MEDKGNYTGSEVLVMIKAYHKYKSELEKYKELDYHQSGISPKSVNRAVENCEKKLPKKLN